MVVVNALASTLGGADSSASATRANNEIKEALSRRVGVVMLEFEGIRRWERRGGERRKGERRRGAFRVLLYFGEETLRLYSETRIAVKEVG